MNWRNFSFLSAKLGLLFFLYWPNWRYCMNQGGAFFAAGTCWNEPHRTSSCNFSPLQCKIALLKKHSITVQSALVQVSDVM